MLLIPFYYQDNLFSLDKNPQLAGFFIPIFNHQLISSFFLTNY